MSEGDVLYHERQRLQLCLLHALNNLLQGQESIDNFTRKELDAIADGLSSGESWWRRHHHRNFLTGNYDANVLLAALATRGFDAAWYDKRKGAVALVDASGDGDGGETSFVGLIANVSAVRFMGLWKGRHWIAVKRFGDAWYNLDSDLTAPLALGGFEAAVSFLDNLFVTGGELFVVTKKKA